ncbi:hypothetical protein [Pseudoduganella sp. R-43]|uniref:hypothetical protein n=1 Tax=unclassified Pseudoduganella TaxID=2637179 RepID=UPI003CE92F7A
MNKLRFFAACAGAVIVFQPMLAKATPPPRQPECIVPPAAAQPISAGYRYSTSLVDAMFKRYLQD